MSKKLIVGIALVILFIALTVYIIVTIADNIPPVGLTTGPGTIYQFQEPYAGARLVLFLLAIAALVSFLSGVILIAMGVGDMR